VRTLLDDAHAIPVKDGGAVYFVARDSVAIVEQLRATMAEIVDVGHGAPRLRFVATTEDDASEYLDDVRRHAFDEIDTLRADVVKMTSTLPSAKGASKRGEAFQARVERARGIEDRAAYLARLLGRSLDDVLDAAKKARAEAEAAGVELRNAIIDGRIQ
jgi:hypothetical protein